MKRTRAKLAPGFSLVETIAAITVMGIIAATVAPMVWQALDSKRSAHEAAALTEEAATTLDRIASELRTIPLDSTNASLDLSTLDDSAIAWNTPAGLVRIRQVAGRIERKVGHKPAIVLADACESLVFRAYADDNTELPRTAPPSAVRRLSVELVMQNALAQASLRTKVVPRSLMGVHG